MSPITTVLQCTLNASALQISMDIPSPKTDVTPLPATYQDQQIQRTGVSS